MQETKTDEKAQAFTENEIANWGDFERVRAGGRYNMFDPRARAASGLTGEEYSFVMKNYSALKKAAGQ